jgi:hypothetical protein
MGVEITKRSGFVVQRLEEQSQHDVLGDVGEIAGVEDVAVVHRDS